LEVALDAPDLLRAFVPYAHAQSRIRDELPSRTLAMVDALRSSYKRELLRQAEVLGPRRCGLAVDHRSDPDPEILELVENKTGTPDLVSSAIGQCAEHAGIAKPVDGDSDRPGHQYVDISKPADTLVLSRDEYVRKS
jgi:hypothetical protein